VSSALEAVLIAAAACGWVLSGLLAATVAGLGRRLELIARAEHELRGPLTALLMGIEAAGDRSARPLESEIARARTALDDLEAARRGRRATQHPAPLVLERCVRGAADAWAPAARRVGGDVRVEWRAGAARVHADAGRLAQVLGNLVSNAVEHGGGRVRVTAEPSPGGVRVEVADEGSHGSVATDRGGGAERGRGLSIAADALAHAGGRLELRRGARGTSALVELPLAPPS